MPQTPEERKEKARWYRIKKTYGIDKEQYDAIRTDRCPICLREFSDSVRPVIDHNHKTGEIRGIICAYCNFRVVGRHTDGDLLLRVVDHLRRSTGWIVPPKPKRRKRRTKRKAS